MKIYTFLLLVFAAEIAFGGVERKSSSGDGPRVDLEERGGWCDNKWFSFNCGDLARHIGCGHQFVAENCKNSCNTCGECMDKTDDCVKRATEYACRHFDYRYNYRRCKQCFGNEDCKQEDLIYAACRDDFRLRGECPETCGIFRKVCS